MCGDKGHSSVTEIAEEKKGSGGESSICSGRVTKLGCLPCGCGVCVRLVLLFLAEVAFPSFSALVERKRNSSPAWQRAISGMMNTRAGRHPGAGISSQIFITQGLGPCHRSDNSLI